MTRLAMNQPLFSVGFEEFGPKFEYFPGNKNVVVDALSCLDKEHSQSDYDTTYDNPANCFAMLDVDFLNVLREDDKLHLAENVFSCTHKEDIVFPLSAQIIQEHQRQDPELLKQLFVSRDTQIQFLRREKTLSPIRNAFMSLTL
jgi:hypothetical protein